MEMNNPTFQPQIPNMPASQPQTPIPQVQPKKIPWVAIGLLVIILLIGGGYLLFSKQIPTNKATKLPPLTVSTQAPAPVAEENLENDLNSIDVEAGASSDFDAIDQDLKQL